MVHIHVFTFLKKKGRFVPKCKGRFVFVLCSGSLVLAFLDSLVFVSFDLEQTATESRFAAAHLQSRGGGGLPYLT